MEKLKIEIFIHWDSVLQQFSASTNDMTAYGYPVVSRQVVELEIPENAKDELIQSKLKAEALEVQASATVKEAKEKSDQLKKQAKRLRESIKNGNK